MKNKFKKRTLILLYILQKIQNFWIILFKEIEPEIKIRVGKKKLSMNLCHKLPIYYYTKEHYDRALPRICSKLKEIDHKLYLIDIGANIGDTVSLITDITSGNFLCVEADKKYLPLLEKNIKLLDSSNKITIERSYCGDSINNEILIKRELGTAKIINTNQNLANTTKQKITIKSLDIIIEENYEFKNTNILKIDTDGFEINVLNGGLKFIKTSKPLIYFEYTPKLYIQNGEDPKQIWHLLKLSGYRDLLFYDNFGRAIGILDINDDHSINTMIKKIDEKNIFYFDVLTYHKDRPEHLEILMDELSIFQ